MGERFVFFIYGHKSKCNLLIIILLLFCLLCQVALEPHVVYCLHIYNTFVVLKTNKPQLFTVVILFYCILCQKYRQIFRLRRLPIQRLVQFIDNHTTRRHHHVWVRYFETTNIIILCMPLTLIHMPYFSLIIILAYHLLSSEPLVVSINLLIVSEFGTVSSFFRWKTQHIKR